MLICCVLFVFNVLFANVFAYMFLCTIKHCVLSRSINYTTTTTTINYYSNGKGRQRVTKQLIVKLISY